MDCTTNCLWKPHGNYLTSAFTAEDIEELKKIIKGKCSNPLRNFDDNGRTILHIAASTGRHDVIEWLHDEWKLPSFLQMKDKESGWNALHRALYYGHIDCAISIYKLIQDWHASDIEGTTPLDLVILDSPRIVKRKKKERLALVVLPFESGEAGELTLHKDDVVEILNANRSGWGVGRLKDTGAKGLFPLNFVEEIKEVEPAKPCQRYTPCNDAYIWGNNVNFVLGLNDSKNRAQPELVEYLWKGKRNIKHVVLTKFHSVFLTYSGDIFTCGHGLGGRLGHEREETVMIPKIVDFFTNIFCSAVDSAHSHTIVLDELGHVYTFGLNDFHQLGHVPPPVNSFSPKQIVHKSLKNKCFVGVAAGRFHSVIYTSHEIYTFGLNAGQLGHPKGDELQTVPRLVSQIYKKDVSISTVVASDGATVCLLCNGDVYLFQDWVCRKIALQMFDVVDICVAGGVLQCSGLEEFNKPDPLRIAVLRNSGIVEVWRYGLNAFKKCYWLGQKVFHSKIIHIALGRHLVLTMNTGQVYFGYFMSKATIDKSANNFPHNLNPPKVEVQTRNFTLTEIIENNKKERKESEEVNLVKVPLLYRAVECFSDAKNRIFAAIQSDARMGLKKYPVVQASSITTDFLQLLSASSLDDKIHDAVIKVKSEKIPIHKFMLNCRLNACMETLDRSRNHNLDSGKVLYDISNRTPQDVKSWLKKIYTGEDTSAFPLNINSKKKEEKTSEDLVFANKMSSLALMDFENPVDEYILNNGLAKKKKSKKKSAYAVHQEKKVAVEANGASNGNSWYPKGNISMESLRRWREYEEVSDVTIESGDGCLIRCHKCILMARTEYFSNMLNNDWMESSICEGGSLKIPLPGNILEVVIHYLYTDEAPNIEEADNISFIGEVLICADQLLLPRLKDICELKLADLVSLKNAIELFEFACDYSVRQLQVFISEFISLNLPYYLEARLLEELPQEYLKVFSKEYQSMVSDMERRKIKPSVQHRLTDDAEKSLQESIVADLNKIKSKRGRASSTASKCSTNVSECETVDLMNQSLHVEQLVNDVFENSYTAPPILENKVKIDRKRIKSENEKGSTQIVWNLGQKEVCGLPTVNDSNSKKNINITPFKKKSQKERKKGRTKSLPPESPSDEKPEKTSPCPWAKSPPQIPSKSFREVLSEEVSPENNEMSPRRIKMGSFTLGAKKKLSLGNAYQDPMPVDDDEQKRNPWNSRSSFSESNDQSSEINGFANIVHVQQEEKRQLTEQAKKPLATIQLEERAIEELMKYYHCMSDQGEYITVQRIKPATASPLWDVVK